MKSFFLPILFVMGCWQTPALDDSYPFSSVGSIHLQPIHDFKHFSGSGEIIKNSMTHSFMKLGYDVIENKNGGTEIVVGDELNTLHFTCIISDYTDKEVMVIPYYNENKGYTETTVSQSTDGGGEKVTSQTDVSTSTTTHSGNVQKGSRLEYIRARVGLMLKLHEPYTGKLVWSHHYWYSGLDLAQTADMCARLALNEFRKIF